MGKASKHKLKKKRAVEAKAQQISGALAKHFEEEKDKVRDEAFALGLQAGWDAAAECKTIAEVRKQAAALGQHLTEEAGLEQGG